MTTMTDPVTELAQLYAEINVDRMDMDALMQYVYEDLFSYYEDMTLDELEDHIQEMGDGDILEDSWQTGLFYNKIVTKGFVSTPFFV